jgi:hypothetical protein
MKGNNDDDDNYIDDAFDEDQDQAKNKNGAYLLPDDGDEQAEAIAANANVVGNGQI